MRKLFIDADIATMTVATSKHLLKCSLEEIEKNYDIPIEFGRIPWFVTKDGKFEYLFDENIPCEHQYLQELLAEHPFPEKFDVPELGLEGVTLAEALAEIGRREWD